MASLFSSSAYIVIVLAYGEASGVLLESREFPCYFFFWEYTKELVYSIPIHTIEVLRERVDDAVITIRNNSEMLEKVEQ
jgi:hypothetical protein